MRSMVAMSAGLSLALTAAIEVLGQEQVCPEHDKLVKAGTWTAEVYGV